MQSAGGLQKRALRRDMRPDLRRIRLRTRSRGLSAGDRGVSAQPTIPARLPCRRPFPGTQPLASLGLSSPVSRSANSTASALNVSICRHCPGLWDLEDLEAEPVVQLVVGCGVGEVEGDTCRRWWSCTAWRSPSF